MWNRDARRGFWGIRQGMPISSLLLSEVIYNDDKIFILYWISFYVPLITVLTLGRAGGVVTTPPKVFFSPKKTAGRSLKIFSANHYFIFPTCYGENRIKKFA